ncbi:MAG TPA: cell division ATP-binding protein FtsE [Myxococcota bacterium]|nr:cell division ATP-binding protein FtsE [Myxococcota bacterium]HQK52240.1 cell division ATP-binding protein FtsE [Myxococcota bacterium]
MPLLSLQGVTKRYPGGVEALRDVSFEVNEGEFLFLAGPSGAGKTTLLRLLVRLEVATQGDILVFGRHLQRIRESSVPYLRRNIGFVFQDFRLLGDRTVAENVALGLHILGLTRREIRSRVEEALADLQLEGLAASLPAALSGGEQQRVAIARALVMHPPLLLADEPTGNLDWDLSNETVRLLARLNRRGTTVIMATHDRFLLREWPYRTLWLHRGALVEDRPASPAPGSTEAS